MTRWMESQIETRASYDAELTERAYAELAASVSGPRRAPQFSVDDIEETMKKTVKPQFVEMNSKALRYNNA